MLTYLVLGGNGQLGQALRKVVPSNVSLIYPKERVDITNFEAVRNAIVEDYVDGVINCAAYTAVDKAEHDFATALAVNAYGPANIAAVCNKLKIDFVHISTDYIFNYSHPIFEDTTPNPINNYGYTKELGEKMVRGVNPNAYIIRTASVYSEFGNNFLKTMLSRYNDGQRDFIIVADQFSCPTYAPDLAEAIFEVLKTGWSRSVKTYHFAGSHLISWAEFAEKILTQMPEPVKISAVSASTYNAPAARPVKSQLVTSHYLTKSDLNKGIEQSLAVLLNKER